MSVSRPHYLPQLQVETGLAFDGIKINLYELCWINRKGAVLLYKDVCEDVHDSHW